MSESPINMVEAIEAILRSKDEDIEKARELGRIEGRLEMSREIAALLAERGIELFPSLPQLPRPENPYYTVSIHELYKAGELDTRAYNCLKRAGFDTLGILVTKTADDLLSIVNFGQVCLSLVEILLEKRGLRLEPDQ